MKVQWAINMEEFVVSDEQRNENADQVEQNAKQGVSRRSFIALAGSGLALATGCNYVGTETAVNKFVVGNPIGSDGWIPRQYRSTGNFPVQVRGRIPIDPANVTIERDDRKCILCGQCVEVCVREQAVMGHYELPLIDYIPCIGCGQCTLWCPTSSIEVRDDTARLWAALENPNLHVVVQTAPSTRVGLGEEFGLPAGTNVEGKQVAALRALGFDAVLDTNFAADLTIMEEATELVQRLTTEGTILPQFTSCCPGWVKYCEMWYPEFIPNLSTARSPMGMLGPVIKTYYADRKGIDPAKIVSVSVMPCTAKKYEAARPEMNNAGTHLGRPEIRDTDLVITTRELAWMLKHRRINLLELEDSPYDDMLSEYTGGGAIFGVTGGVMEATVRTAYHFITGNSPPPTKLELKPVRGLVGIKDATLDIPGFREIRVAVVHGTANAKRVLDKILNGEVAWDFIEVMACQGGCIGGGGQPKTTLPPSDVVRYDRIRALYDIDEREGILRSSYENPQIKALYENFLGEPCEGLAYELLHTHGSYVDRSDRLVARR